jgi:hypothetical protein
MQYYHLGVGGQIASSHIILTPHDSSFGQNDAELSCSDIQVLLLVLKYFGSYLFSTFNSIERKQLKNNEPRAKEVCLIKRVHVVN